ncbi:MAG: hypothetical protein Q7T01_02765 [bacterium]|nr:hypothetical protein [bacterium]
MNIAKAISIVGVHVLSMIGAYHGERTVAAVVAPAYPFMEVLSCV